MPDVALIALNQCIQDLPDDARRPSGLFSSLSQSNKRCVYDYRFIDDTQWASDSFEHPVARGGYNLCYCFVEPLRKARRWCSKIQKQLPSRINSVNRDPNVKSLDEFSDYDRYSGNLGYSDLS
jgi:hypothetical protein